MNVDITEIFAKEFKPDMVTNHTKYTKVIQAQDKKIINELAPASFLHIYSEKDIYVVHKYPIINPKTKQVVGILGYMELLILPNALKLVCDINGLVLDGINKKVVNHDKLKRELNDKQKIVLFLIINKYSGIEIGKIMRKLRHTISDAAVNEITAKLKYLFNVKSKQQLIEKAIGLKYHTYIPMELLKVGIYDINDKIYSQDG